MFVLCGTLTVALSQRLTLLLLQAAAEESAAAIEKVEVPQQRSSSDMDTAMEEEAAAKAAAKLAGSSDSDSDRTVPGLQAEALRNILGTKAEEQVGCCEVDGPHCRECVAIACTC